MESIYDLDINISLAAFGASIQKRVCGMQGVLELQAKIQPCRGLPSFHDIGIFSFAQNHQHASKRIWSDPEGCY